MLTVGKPFVKKRSFVSKQFRITTWLKWIHCISMLVFNCSGFPDYFPYVTSLTPHSACVRSYSITDVAENREPKRRLWSELQATFLSKDDFSHIFLVCDFTSRFDSSMEPSQQHIGPAVVSKRVLIDDDDLGYAVVTLSLCASPQTFLEFPFRMPATSKKESKPFLRM